MQEKGYHGCSKIKARVFSGVQPTGNLHIGNYLGALKNWVEIQGNYESIFGIVDLHAITVYQQPGELRAKILEIAALFLAAGGASKPPLFNVERHSGTRSVIRSVSGSHQFWALKTKCG